MKAHLRNTWFVLITYLGLTVLLTWPTALHLTNAIPGDGFDGWQNYWNLWWVKQALLILGTNPYFTDYLYAPTGVSLLFHTLNIFNAWWTLPLQLNFGLAIAYNSVVFVSFTLAGYGGYLLSLDTLRRLQWPVKWGLRPAAFVGGLVFTMSPFHMAHLLGHMQVFSMIWPPFYILWLLRTLEPWSSRAIPVTGRHWRNIALTGLFLVLATLVDWYHTLYLLLFTGLALLWTLWQRWQVGRRSRGAGEQGSKLHVSRFTSSPFLQPIWTVLTISLGFAVLLSPLLLPMIRAAGSRPDLQTGLVQNITLSADLLAFVTPSEMHPLWGDWAKSIAANFSSTTSERLIFAGFAPLALALLGAIGGRSKAVVRFWVVVTLGFVILALGPYLHIGGEIVTIGQWAVPMPYLLLYHIVPFIGLTRSLSRYDLMVMLGLGVLAAVGLLQLQLIFLKKRISSSKAEGSRRTSRFTFHASGIFSFVALVLICFEFLPAPYPISRIDTPAFFYQLAAETEDYTIAELPMNWDRPTPLLHQTTHGKRLLTAYTSRDNPLELAWRTPVLQHWRYLGPDIIDQPLAAIAPTIFYDFNLRYIVLDYWQMPPGPERAATEQWVLAALPGVTPIYDDGRLRVFQTPPQTETVPYLSLGHGWSERQEDGAGSVSRSFTATEIQGTELFLHHPNRQAHPVTLELTARSDSSQKVTLLANNDPVASFALSEAYSPQTITLPSFASDLVKLSLQPEQPGNQVWVKRVSLGPVD